MAEEYTPEQDSWLQFPCDFTIKVMGKNNDQFENSVLGIVREFFPHFGNGHIQRLISKNNTYLSLTLTLHPTSREQLDAIYQALSANPEVLMAL